jgi:hypothetical protein
MTASIDAEKYALVMGLAAVLAVRLVCILSSI